MNIQLIHGEFSSGDALDLVTQMIHLKIKYHEGKISRESAEEDIKYRESKIKALQKELYEFRKFVELEKGNVKLDSLIRAEK